MNKYTKLAIVGVLSSTLVACSSSDDDSDATLVTDNFQPGNTLDDDSSGGDTSNPGANTENAAEEVATNPPPAVVVPDPIAPVPPPANDDNAADTTDNTASEDDANNTTVVNTGESEMFSIPDSNSQNGDPTFDDSDGNAPAEEEQAQVIVEQPAPDQQPDQQPEQPPVQEPAAPEAPAPLQPTEQPEPVTEEVVAEEVVEETVTEEVVEETVTEEVVEETVTEEVVEEPVTEEVVEETVTEEVVEETVTEEVVEESVAEEVVEETVTEEVVEETVTEEVVEEIVTEEVVEETVTEEVVEETVTEEVVEETVTEEVVDETVTEEVVDETVTEEVVEETVTEEVVEDTAAEEVVEEEPADDDTTAGDRVTPQGRSALGNPPTLVDPFADAIPSPNSADPFGTLLEVDNEVPVAGGAPTQPKNLRAELVANDWAEMNWAPSNDDGAVVEYRIYRSDGHIYSVRGDDIGTSGGAQDEIDKYWTTTSFMDCNFTRFSTALHACALNAPSPGDTFSYEVTAIDDEGQESPRSNTLTIAYHAETNAPVPNYDDFFKSPIDSFAQDHDLSDTSFFLDKFDLVFEDNFDGPTIDETKWNTGLTWGDTRIINGEQQYFVNTQLEPGFGYDPFKFENGELIIEAIQTPDEFVDSLPPVCDEEDPTGNDRCQFLSGALSSHDLFGITYGYVEGRMKAGNIAGMLSSFYLYHRFPGQGIRRHGPEIDILEYLGENPFGDEDAFQTYHYVDPLQSENGENFIRSAPTMFHENESGEEYGEDYHTFGVLWEPQLMIWYIDGKEIQRVSGVQVARQQLNVVLYLVAGSAWAPTPADDAPYPLQFNIDYIRAYQRPEYSNNGIYPDR